jgi:ABC-type lipoprotein release transport system permease subunit
MLSGSIADAVSDLGLRPSLDYYFEFSSLIVPNLRLLGGLLFVSLYPVYQLFHFRTKNTSLRMWSFNSLGLIPSLAWKNLLRNPTRSLLIVSSIGIGLGVGTFIWAFANGLQTQRLQYQLNHSLGHLKITHRDFDEEKPLNAFLHFEGDLKEKIETLGEEMTAFSPRLNVYGMANSSKNNLTVDIYGIIPAEERKVFLMYQNVIKGSYFKDDSIKNPILIGNKLAQYLNLRLGEHLLLTLPQLNQVSRQDTFKVVGIYAMHNERFEKTHVFIQASDFQKYTGLRVNDYHQIMLKTSNHRLAIPLSDALQSKLPSYQVKSWAEIAPEFAYLEEVLGQFFTIFTGIILLALSFALMNMMLMSVLERQQEWAMLISVGMQKKQIFLLVILETIFLAVFGLGVGLGLAWISIAWSHSVGIDLAWFDTQFTKMGINTKIYPFLTYKEYLTVGVLLIITALLSALYPAWLALKTNTVKALHKN